MSFRKVPLLLVLPLLIYLAGPGEDAGLKYIRTLKDISTNLDEVKAKAGELGRVEEDLINSQTELTKEIALLFDATGGSFEKMTTKIKLFGELRSFRTN